MLLAPVALIVLSLSVGAHSNGTGEWDMPTTISDIGITVNGRDAFYERASSCSAYFYRLGVIGRINACHKDWIVRVNNHSNKGARVRLTIRKAV